MGPVTKKGLGCLESGLQNYSGITNVTLWMLQVHVLGQCHNPHHLSPQGGDETPSPPGILSYHEVFRGC